MAKRGRPRFTPSLRVKRLRPWPINTGAGKKSLDPADLNLLWHIGLGALIIRIYRRKVGQAWRVTRIERGQNLRT